MNSVNPGQHEHETSPETGPAHGPEASRGEPLRDKVTSGSPVRAYQDLVAGTDTWLGLIRYELLASWGAPIPGAVGLAFRKITWPYLFASADRSVVWGRSVELRHPGKMRLGERVVVDDQCRLDAKGCEAGQFIVEDDAMISRACVVSAKEGGIRIRARATLGVGTVLYSFGGIEIGEDTMIAAYCFIGGGRYEHRGRTDIPMHRQPLPGRGVRLGRDCWLGAGATVVDGVTVGQGSVVAAGSVVLEDVPEYTVVGGVPARPLGERSGGDSNA